ncbi:MAG: amino acid adenylation domain-containing protein, partial [Thermoanaerobaculia bacterium]
AAAPGSAAAPASNLTRYQRLLWMSQKLDAGAPLLASAGTARLRTRIVPEVLAQAFQSVVDGSDALRTTIEEIDEIPFQRVGDRFHCALDFQDLSARSDPMAEARALAFERCRVPHQVARSLVDAALYKLGEDDFLWYMNLNHLIADAWAVTVVLRAVYRAYEALLAGQPPPDLPLPPFADYVEQERELLASPGARRAEEHWREKLSRDVEQLSFYGAAPARRSGRVERLTFDLGVERSARLKLLAAREPFYLMSTDLSLFSMLGALVCAYLGRISGNRTLSLGVPFHNRPTEAAKQTVGLLMQILPLRIALDAGETFASLAEKLALENLEGLQFRSFPVGNPLRNRAYDVEFNYMPMAFPLFAGVPIEFEWFHAGHGGDSLAVQIFDLGGSLRMQLDFHCDVFGDRQRQLGAGHLLRVIDAFLEDPGRQIGSFSLLADEERRQVLWGLNASARELPLGQGFAEAFQAQVERTPEAIAVADDGGTLTYAELHERVCRLSLWLEVAGVGPESIVAVLARRDRVFLAALLAVLRAGGAYLPLDPEHPASRLRQLLRQSGAAVALVTPELRPELLRALDESPAGERPVVLDLEAGSGAGVAAPPPLPDLTRRLAYVIYTSGSTGVPKGAMVEEVGMMNHLRAKIADLGLTGADVVAQSASQCFDISVWQLLAALLVGGRVRIYPDVVARDPARLLGRVEEDRITVLETVPSLLRAMLDELESAGNGRSRVRTLRWLLVTGEALPADSCRRWLDLYPEVPLVNAYGPTECSDDVTHHVLRQAPEGAVPIGTPIANLRAYVVDHGGFPVPVGVAGELWIGGAGVGRGYLRDAQRTAEVFVPDSFSGERGGRLYRTGDLARFRPDGCLDFLGRIDHQVKIRGQRIEPGEIETVLRGHPGVREAVVLARREEAGELSLVAYLVPHAGAGPKPAELRAYFRERLPESMVPSACVLLDALPLTPSGKLDRAALPAPEGGRGALEESIVAPRNPREAALAAIWREVLDLTEVGVQDNFFELGGDSILSIQIASRASRAGLRFNPVQIFEHPTIARLAEVVQVRADCRGEQGVVTGPLPLTPIQRRFFELDLPNPHHWNQSILLEVARPLVMPRLAAALSRLLAHHDALRLRFHGRAAGWEQVLAEPSGAVPLSWLDLSALPEGVRSDAVERAAAALQGSLHLSAGPLLRLAWFDCGAGRPGRLLLIAHHLVV